MSAFANIMTEDGLYAIAERMSVPDLLQFRSHHQADAHIVNYELRRRQLVIKAHDFNSMHQLHQHLCEIRESITKVDIDCHTTDRDFCEYQEEVMAFLASCNPLKRVSLTSYLDVSKSAVSCVPDFSALETLRITNGLSEKMLAAYLDSCKAGILRELVLKDANVGIGFMKNIPGQLNVLQLTDFVDDDWTSLYMYAAQYPLLLELNIETRPHRTQTLNLGQLCNNLRKLRKLRLDIDNGTHLVGFGNLALLVDLESLDICITGPRFADYLHRLTCHHKLTKLRIEAADFEFRGRDIEYLRNLPNLRVLEISVGPRVRGLTALIKALSTVEQLRTFALYSGQFNESLPAISPVLVMQRLAHLEELRIELPPQKLEKLAKLKRLRKLTLRINNRHCTNHRKQLKNTGQTNRFLRSLCRANCLQELRIVAQDRIKLASDIPPQFRKFTRLHKLELLDAMEKADIVQLRSAVSNVKVFRYKCAAPEHENWDDLITRSYACDTQV